MNIRTLAREGGIEVDFEPELVAEGIVLFLDDLATAGGPRRRVRGDRG